MKTHSLEITPDILREIVDIDDFKGSWGATQHLAPYGSQYYEKLQPLKVSALLLA